MVSLLVGLLFQQKLKNIYFAVIILLTIANNVGYCIKINNFVFYFNKRNLTLHLLVRSKIISYSLIRYLFILSIYKSFWILNYFIKTKSWQLCILNKITFTLLILQYHVAKYLKVPEFKKKINKEKNWKENGFKCVK